jgi:nitroreductase
MDALELLVGRESATKLASPGPDQEALERMFQSALRAPDHGRLRPWRFVVVPEEKRERFGELMADCLLRQQPDAPADMLQRERDKAMRAPVIVVAAAAIQRGHKIPEVEQLVSAASAAENIMLAARALGFGAMWKTGAPAYDATVKQALGLDPDNDIVGFLYRHAGRWRLTRGEAAGARPRLGVAGLTDRKHDRRQEPLSFRGARVNQAR